MIQTVLTLNNECQYVITELKLMLIIIKTLINFNFFLGENGNFTGKIPREF